MVALHRHFPAEVVVSSVGSTFTFEEPRTQQESDDEAAEARGHLRVGTRDGIQIEPDWIPTEVKVEIVDRLSATGVPNIEVTSFVSPKAIPALKDAEAVMAQIKRRPGTVYAALVPNDKGAVRAVDAGVDVIHTVLSASESHNLANVNMTVDESLTKLRAVMEVARRAGKPVYSGISCTFGCPFETEVPLAQLERVVGALVDMGARGSGSPTRPAWRTPCRSSGSSSASCPASRGSSGRCTRTTRARWPSRTSSRRWRWA